VLTASSIRAAKGVGYARYLESKTVEPERGDYYLSPAGEPTQAPGRWLTTAETRLLLGIDGRNVDGEDFIALMEGRHPRTGAWIRSAGADGNRGGGIDLTFSAPKSVSTVWALGSEDQRRGIEEAHAAAVGQAMAYLAETVATVRRGHGGLIEETARDLVAAEYLHTTARGVVDGDVPDPQIHSHVVVTNAIRKDGRVVAVASRPVFRATREVGAYYRSALATELGDRGYAIEAGTGNRRRYFEIAGVPRALTNAFSARTREVTRAAERFRAKWGREPERGDLRRLKLENRKSKTLVTRRDLQRSWEETADQNGLPLDELTSRLREAVDSAPDQLLESRLDARLTERSATFAPGEFRAVLLEQSVGQLSPDEALELGQTLISDRRVLRLKGGSLTTRTVRASEEAIEGRFARLAVPADRETLVVWPARRRSTKSPSALVPASMRSNCTLSS
jgi:conjugative relaxase-like TrwC/TraI family protein